MKKVIAIISISLLTIISCVEAGIILNQHNIISKQQTTLSEQGKKIQDQQEVMSKTKEQEHKKLAEKVIIQTYNEIMKAGSTPNSEPVGLIKENMKIIANSYNGDDVDIKNMLSQVQDYLDYRMYKVGLMPEYKGYSKEKDGFGYYSKVKDSVSTCISKYALFDKVGLYK